MLPSGRLKPPSTNIPSLPVLLLTSLAPKLCGTSLDATRSSHDSHLSPIQKTKRHPPYPPLQPCYKGQFIPLWAPPPSLGTRLDRFAVLRSTEHIKSPGNKSRQSLAFIVLPLFSLAGKLHIKAMSSLLSVQGYFFISKEGLEPGANHSLTVEWSQRRMLESKE